MTLKGICRAFVPSLLVSSQMVWPNCLLSLAESSTGTQPALLKIESTEKNSTAKPPSEKASAKTSPGDKQIEKTVSAGNAKSVQREAKSKDAARPSKRSKDKGSELIPPPPAFQPSYLIGPGSQGLPLQLDFMSKEMMLARLKSLGKQLTEAKSELDDKIAQMKERKEKYERFGSLYKEGVVSRHELEAAGKEAEEAGKDVEHAQAGVSELESEKTALQDRLKPQAKKLRQSKKVHSEKKHK